MLDVNKIKKDFSMFENNPGLVYLDSAATSLTPDCVVEAMNEYYFKYRATVHRSKYLIGQRADLMYENSRHIIADFINAEFEEIIFCKSVTSGLNLVARDLVKNLVANDEILISELDHHSNVLCWREYNTDLTIKYCKLENNKITVNSFLKSITSKTKVVSLNHVSNVLGDVTPIKEIAKICREKGIIFVVDGAQAITHEKIDVKDIGCDYYLFTSHKMCGPTGLGVCYINKSIINDVRFEYGGDMTIKVTKTDALYAQAPIGLEAGTPPIAEVIGLARACQYLTNIGIENINNHVLKIKEYLILKMQEIEEIVIHNPTSHSGIVTFNISNYSAHDCLQGLENSKIDVCIRGGHMCNLLSLGLLNQSSVLRASIYLYTSTEDIDQFIKALKITVKGGLDFMLGGDLF